MLLCIVAEDRESFVVALLALKPACVKMNLQRAGQIERFFLRRLGVVLAIQRGQDLRLRDFVVETIFVLNRLVGIVEGVVESTFSVSR